MERGEPSGYTTSNGAARLVVTLGKVPRPLAGSACCKGSGPMKKGGILNPAICSLLAELGHGDELLIVDAGYPLPPDGHVID